ncbi:MAG: UDP-N-acetylmuramoyl-L-alanine--D-glutamate ligase [Fidelibacterota bacterium]
MDITTKQDINLNNKRVTVIGAARSGLAAAKLLLARGAHVFLSDRDASLRENPDVAALVRSGVETEFGYHSERLLEADLLVVSPGVPQDAGMLVKASERGVAVVSEIELASWFTNLPVAAVTGSNGKTTTATLLAEMIRQGDFVPFLAGNIGIPFSATVLQNLDREPGNGIHVLEISSFQMEHIVHFRPRVAVLLNLTADHLDRYRSLDDYARAKLRILANMTANEHVVYNKDDPFLSERIRTEAVRVPFSLGENPGGKFSVNETKIYDDSHEVVAYLKDLGIPGKHNVANMLAAATASTILNVPVEGIRQVMKTFTGVPHRLQFVRSFRGVDFYNDSKATNVGSVRVALEAFSRPILLIMGGRDKGARFGELVPLVSSKVRHLFLLGEAAGTLENVFSPNIPTSRVDSMESAVSRAQAFARRGDVVLLSPGCASFDMYSDYEDRGNNFINAVERLGRTD